MADPNVVMREIDAEEVAMDELLHGMSVYIRGRNRVLRRCRLNYCRAESAEEVVSEVLLGGQFYGGVSMQSTSKTT